MFAYSLKRFGVALLVVFVVSIATFTFTNVAVDPAVAISGEGATDADIQAIREAYGFDRPLQIQYADWLRGVATADFGRSIRQRRPVVTLLGERFPITATLGATALLIALCIAVPLGVLAALYPNSWIDRVALTIAVVGMAMPTFWFGLMLMIVFGIMLHWLPISGTGTPLHFVMPALALSYYSVPIIMRLTRAGMIEVLASDYIRTARAKGLLPRSVLFKHALRNAVIPVVAVAAVQFGHLLGGSVVVESVFALPGIGYLAWEAINAADLPVIQAVVVVLSAFYILLVFLSDILNAYLDPRIRIA
jgi:peptide/nickel transport system permease protein